MTTVNELPLITVQIMNYRHDGTTAWKHVDFKIYRKDNQLKAIPLMSKEERLSTQLPEELVFIYVDHCIVAANNMDEEPLNAIKKIIQELEAQDLL